MYLDWRADPKTWIQLWVAEAELWLGNYLAQTVFNLDNVNDAVLLIGSGSGLWHPWKQRSKLWMLTICFVRNDWQRQSFRQSSRYNWDYPVNRALQLRPNITGWEAINLWASVIAYSDGRRSLQQLFQEPATVTSVGALNSHKVGALCKE